MAHNNSQLKILVFNEPTYPQALSHDILTKLVPGSFQVTGSSDLSEHLTSGYDVLVSFHGSYFPKESWLSILRFLENGGHLANFGGMPFTQPVRADGTIEHTQHIYTQHLNLGPVFQIDLPTTELCFQPAREAAFLSATPLQFNSEAPGTFWSSYPKLTQRHDHPDELGSAGTLDTLVTPLVYVTPRTIDPQQPQRLATAAFLLDQQHGTFRGGRWLISAWQPATTQDWLNNASLLQQCISLAASSASILDIAPAEACYQPGEAPSLLIAARTRQEIKVEIAISSPQQETIHSQTFTLSASSLRQEQRIQLPTQTTPGLYRVEMRYTSESAPTLRQETGFWLWDAQLVASTANKRLTPGRDYFYQDGHIFPIFGTTYMDSHVQRKFLLLPNPARWDNDFAEMSAAGINLIRTGIWTAWRELMPTAGVSNETFLRAFDAFVLSAAKHNIQVIFNFFAFTPPLFEGDNPWLDPRSLEGQRDFITTFTSRYTDVATVSWDLINEPSFGNPKHIFATRPIANNDRFEIAAFRTWLRKRYTLEELQIRWRLTPAQLNSWDQVTPPTGPDYSTNFRDTHNRTMLKVVDYTLFSQDAFTQWAAYLYEAIRASGNNMLVGVGQDEAGSRPAPQFHASAVDYTTTHPWWNNDALLWDMLTDKTIHKPNLIQETGVMLVRDIDMQPWRTEQECANLLERKLYTGLAARGAGLIQWLWHINANMDNENENSIGLVRPDGSAKPELTAMLEFGHLIQVIQPILTEAPTPPDVWLIHPYSQLFLKPDITIEATRRAVRTLGYDLGIIPQIIGEHQLPDLLNYTPATSSTTNYTPTTSSTTFYPRAIILPSIQNLPDTIWQALLTFAQRGTTIIISGTLSIDHHNLTAPNRLNLFPNTHTQPSPVSRFEYLNGLTDAPLQLIFANEKMGNVRKGHNNVHTVTEGQGKIIWSGLPVELADTNHATQALYQYALPPQTQPIIPQTHSNTPQNDQESPILITQLPLTHGTLHLIINESSHPQTLSLPNGKTLTIQPNRAGAALITENDEISLFGGTK